MFNYKGNLNKKIKFLIDHNIKKWAIIYFIIIILIIISSLLKQFYLSGNITITFFNIYNTILLLTELTFLILFIIKLIKMIYIYNKLKQEIF